MSSAPPLSRATFVVGTGRCGSTLLSNILNLHPRILSVSELLTVLGGGDLLRGPELTGSALRALLQAPAAEIARIAALEPIPELLYPRGAGEDLSGVAAPLLVPLPHLTHAPHALFEELCAAAEGFSAAPPSVQIHRVVDWLRVRLEREVWIERSGASIEYLPEFDRCWPDARYVYLARDGRDCALSMSRHPLFRVRLARMVRRDPDLDVATCLATTVPLLQYGLYWSALMGKAHRSLSRLPSRRALLLDYEALLTDTAAQMQRLAAFLEVDHRPLREHAPALLRPTGHSFRDLPEGERAQLDQGCKQGMHLLARLATRR